MTSQPPKVLEFVAKERIVVPEQLDFPVTTQPEAEERAFFSDARVNTIDETFSGAIKEGLLHNYVDDDELSGRLFSIKDQEFVNFSTCSYFGLELDPRVKAGISQFADRYGASFIMSRTYASAPRFGEFEELLTEVFGAYPIVTPSTTLGHLSFVSVMIQPNDVILLDQQVHNSVQLAATTVAHKAKAHVVKHSDMGRLAQSLEKFSADPSVNNIWYFGDGIYSMFGDLAPMAELTALLDRFPKFYCYLDDAHGMSIMGENGRGYVLGHSATMHPKMAVAVSLSKCFGMGCGGALIVPNKEWQRKIRTCGPTMIFSSPVPPPMLGAGIALAKIHLSPEITVLQEELQEKIALFRYAAKRAGVDVLSDSRSPVQYIKIGTAEATVRTVKAVLNRGYFVNFCAFPAVPKNKCGLRLTLTRHVTDADIQGLIDSITGAMRSGAAS